MISFEEKQEALEAGRILQSNVFRRIFTDIEMGLIASWKAGKTVEEREECWLMLNCLHAIRKELLNRIQCAAVKEKGKDEALNTALKNAKGKTNG